MLAEKYPDQIQALLARYPQRKSAILHLMHLAQNEYGYLSEEAMSEVAEIAGVDRTHVLSLAGFYSLFNEEPTGRYVLEICNDLACALRGADEFVQMACDRLGVGVSETTDDGLFTVRTVMCLGACDRVPMLQCNLKFYENLEESTFDALISQLRAEAASGARPPSVVERIIGYTTPEVAAAGAAPAAPVPAEPSISESLLGTLSIGKGKKGK